MSVCPCPHSTPHGEEQQSMRRPGAAMPIAAWDRPTIARARRHLLPLRSGPISHTKICCPSLCRQVSPCGSTRRALLHSVLPARVTCDAAPANIPRAGGNPTNPAVTSSRVGVQARRPAKMLAGRSDVPATPISPTWAGLPRYLSFPSLSRPPPLLSSCYDYYCHYSFSQNFQKRH